MLKGRKLRPVCGDFVTWQDSDNPGEAVVTAVEDRRNELQRPDMRGKTETLAANLDTLVIVAAPEPAPDFFIIDRFLCAAEIMGARGVLVWNKTDLNRPEPDDMSHYQALGYELLRVSADAGSGMNTLEQVMSQGAGMLVGQSGVGKSSLINHLLAEAGVATGELSNSREGRHTTTASFAHRLTTGGTLIDSPGVRDFAPVIDEPGKIQNGFIEILGLADQCRFSDCTHTREPDCAVKRALDEGQVDSRRYDSYKRLRNMTAQAAERQRPG